MANDIDDAFVLGGKSYRSRLIIGTGKYKDLATNVAAMEASGAEIITVAIRRVDAASDAGKALYAALKKYTLLPNTAGCFTAKDAVLTCRLAREALDTKLVKVEVIGDERTLFPDNAATIEACRELVKDGFTVLPYVSDDPIVCKKLEELGCAAVMPLGAPIGSGLGIRNPHNLRIILEQAKIPVIVDAGVGTASDAAIAMELGCDAVLMNTAIAGAKDPVGMARAMKLAVEAGRLASRSGRIAPKLHASASSPISGVIEPVARRT
jgi:thiazole synthase